MKGSSTFAKKYGNPNTSPDPQTDESENIIKEALLEERNIDIEAIKTNYGQINSIRLLSAMLAGIFAGIFCLTGLVGLSLYLINFAIISIFIFAYIHLSKGNFFQSEVMMLFHGFASHSIVFTIFWVMFYNLVHIYI